MTGSRVSNAPRCSKDVTVLHAGTGLDDHGRPVTAGGRVLGVTGTGPVVAGAREKAYGAVDVISWEGMQYRRDIAAGMGAGAAPS